jgi:hypothetical protein
MAKDPAGRSLEDRLRAVEDQLAILHLIASHPPAADSGTAAYYRNAFVPDAVTDLGGGKAARGNDEIGAMVERPEHQAAIAGGLAHFGGLPRIDINGDTAVVTSYLQILTPDTAAEPVVLSGHGSSRSFRIHRVGASRWELVRTPQGWKILRRELRTLDGSAEAREILRRVFAPPST